MTVITATCPKCHAQYQLQPEQLSIAAGKVRCGNCMTVFQATPAPVSAAPTIAPTPPKKNTSSGPQRSAFVNDFDEKLVASIEDEEMISDGEDEHFEPKPKAESFPEFSPEFDQVLRENGLLDNDKVDSLENDESWAEQLLEEEDFEIEETPKNKKAAAKTKDNDDPFAVDLDDLGISLELTQDEEEALNSIASKDDLRNRIQAEPLEFVLSSRKSLWLNLALALVAIIAMAALTAQLLYFQFNELARTPQWRNTYASICQQIGCTLPEQYDISAIKASQLTVKSHPYINNALMVDTVMINQANSEQPFPNFQLMFTDNNGAIVAARSFKPSDYLRGELAHATLMPSRQPIHLALEINDPSLQATGYWMQLSYTD